MTVVDVHCHAFNADDLPVRGFVLHTKLGDVPLGAKLSTVLDAIVQHAATDHAVDLARMDAILGPASPFEAAAAVEPQSADEFERDVDEIMAELQASQPAALHDIGVAAAEAEASAPGALGGEEGIGDVVAAARRAVRWVRMFTRSRLDQIADLVRTFDDEVDLFTPLLVDLGTGLGDAATTSNAQQMALYEKISRLSMLGRLPGVQKAQVHHFIGFDPLRELRARAVGDIETPLALVQTAVLRYGFVGVKVYPQMGWRPSGNEAHGPLDAAAAAAIDAIVLDLAAWCAANDVPITAHCSSSNYADERFAQGEFGSPAQWLPVLAAHPGLHLNLGHFGGARRGEAADGWPWQIARAMAASSGLYADVGNHRIDDQELVTAYFAMLQAMCGDAATEVVAHRLMYGSDWFMEAIHPEHDRFLHNYRTAFEANLGAEATAAFMGGNALRFLGFDDPSNRNNQRLRARYERFAPDRVPAWLAVP